MSKSWKLEHVWSSSACSSCIYRSCFKDCSSRYRALREFALNELCANTHSAVAWDFQFSSVQISLPCGLAFGAAHFLQPLGCRRARDILLKDSIHLTRGLRSLTINCSVFKALADRSYPHSSHSASHMVLHG